MLDRDYYCVSGMKVKAASDFNAWYDGQVAKNVSLIFGRNSLIIAFLM